MPPWEDEDDAETFDEMVERIMCCALSVRRL